MISHPFTVNMACTDVTFTNVYVTGPWADWCGDCFPLSDLDGDNVWEVSIAFEPSQTIEYKYVIDNWAHQENLVDDMLGGANCAPVTDYAEFANRTAPVGTPPSEPETYGSCNACTPDDPPAYTLFWADEFDGTALGSHWEPLIGNGSQYNIPGWGNNELQWYAESQATVADGFLTITAEPTPSGPAAYTSARIRTIFGFKYGRFEARIKIPQGQGIWPAFWMLPMSGSWPWAGEIDIMEVVGNAPNTLHGTVHMGSPTGHVYQGNSTTVPGLADSFHTYGVTWTNEQIIWDVNGDVYFTLTKDGVSPAFWPFDDRYFHILLNVAVGGTWPGPPDSTTVFPQKMIVDWVRVYKTTPTTASSPPIQGCMDPAAVNFEATAEVEDGTCNYTVTFAIDMSSSTVAQECGMHVFGEFNDWQVWADPMQDTDGDDIWTTQINIGMDQTVEFKFAGCGESAIEALMPGSACTITTGEYTNRSLTVTAPYDMTSNAPCFGSCNPCP